MNLQIIVPLFEFDYIGENKSLDEMFIDGSKFHENLKEYVFDDQYNFRLVKFSYEDYSKLEIDTLSKIDCDRLQYSNWGLLFECEEERLDEYKQKINLLLLAFRIINQSDVQIKYLICINFPYLSIKYPDDWKYAIAESRIKRNAEAINKFELENVLEGYYKLKKFLDVSYRTSHAVNFLFLSYTSFYWMEIFLLLMTALETLVSPDKKDKIVSEVSERVVCLINNKELCTKSKFQKIYDLRSDIIHGKVLVELNFQKELPRLQQLQKIVLETFNILLNSTYKEIYKDEYSKEDFYKKLTSNEKLEKTYMNKSISRTISEFAVNLKYNDLPKEVIHEVKRYLYDSIGCAYGGYRTKDVKIIHNIYKDMAGKKESTVIGFGDRIPAVNATLVNSLMIRALDFNDIYWKEDPSHPSDIIPAALSVGEMVGASMKEVITAIVLAYEFEQRLCLFASPGVRERKWHHATLTQFVSPIVAGKMLGLNVDQMVNAIGISGSHNHTIGCPTAGKLTMMKNTVDPMAVQSGVLAALMAKKGYTGTEAVFEGKEGFMDTFLGWNAKEQKVDPVSMKGRDGVSEWKWNVDKLIGGLGESYKIMECSMKAFPTEALTHTHLSATLNAVTKNHITYDQIETVTLTTLAQAYDILFDPHKYRPESRETADHSLPYCIAAALVDHKITTQSFSDEKLRDPRIWEVIDKIKGEPSQEFEKMFPAKQPSKVVVKTKDGREFSEYLEYPKGDPREPMTMEDLDNKFEGLVGKLLTKGRRNEVKEAIFEAELLTAREFMKKLIV